MHKYRGFISYSHADKAAANRLLKRLQAYRLPKGTAKQSDRGLGRFFMDRESLPAADSLSDAISTGLANAQTLIVLCSPAAAKSEWVRKEIEAFRELNPDKEALAVVLSGHPEARAGDQVCFPSPLLADNAEPLAADFRKNGDGRKLGFLKLVAALSGTPLETLLRRDQTRQRNRVMAITALSALITLCMSTLAAVAISARQDSEARRADAEGLVDFMLTDLKDRLEPVGRLDVLDGVASEVLNYYDGQIDELDCAAIIHNARALHLATEIHTNKDELDQATFTAQRALSLIQLKRSECGSDPEFMIADGHSEYWASAPIWREANAAYWRPGSEKNPEEYRPLFRSLFPFYERYGEAIAPLCKLPDYRSQFIQEVADNAINFGSIYFILDDLEPAKTYFDEAIEQASKIALIDREIPNNSNELAARKTALFTLANAYGWRSIIFEKKGNYAEAIVDRIQEKEIYESLAYRETEYIDNPALSLVYQTQIAILRLRWHANDPALTDLNFSDLENDIRKLTKEDPDNQSWADLLAKISNLRMRYTAEKK